MTFLRKINDFVGELQKKNDQEKRQWLIASTAVSMTIVLVLWGFYFSSTIRNLSEQKSARSSGFGATFNQGLKVISDKIGLQISKTMESAETYLKATNSVTIQPTNLEFSAEVEPINPNKFP